MKPNVIILEDDGLYCFEAPEKLEYLDKYGNPHEEDYNKALEAAKKQKVRFKDQVFARSLFNHMEYNKLYPVPDGYEIKIENKEWSEKLPSGSFIQYDQYAILVPKKESNCKEYCNCAEEAMKRGASRDWVDGTQDNCPLKPKQELVPVVQVMQEIKEAVERITKQPTSIEEAAESYAIELYPINGESKEVVAWIEKQKILIEMGFIAGAKSQASKYEVDLLTIRNKFVAMMPIGDVSAWDCITAMKNYTLWLDEFIEQLKQEKK
jgi:hypothetical protein